jgi:3-phenylpropionate/trans-cinnamate dioxygenase ferredoxin component
MNILMEKAIEMKKLADGQMKTVMVDGTPIAVSHIGSSFFAMDDICSHAQCSLGTDGLLSGHSVMCACHGATFDVTNGKALTLPATTDIKTYTVELKNGWVYIGRKG